MEPATLKLFPDYVKDFHNQCLQKTVVSNLIEDKKFIGTHNTTFHSDETMAVSLLTCLPQFKDHAILRTRNLDLLQKCDIVVDVGGIYDHSIKRYDHHQPGFAETFGEGYEITLSSVGLVWKHYGKEILKSLNLNLSDSDLEDVYIHMYSDLIQSIDANDNGISVSDTPLKFPIRTNLSNRIRGLNISWTEDYSEEKENEHFKYAMALSGGEFLSILHNYIDDVIGAKRIVEDAFNSTELVHPSKKILKLDTACPFMSHLYKIEEAHDCPAQTLYAISPNRNNTWNVRAINISSDSFAIRKPLCPDWAGLRDQELEEKSGIPGTVFVHRNLFIGAAKTYEGALQMAIKSLDYKEPEKEN